MQPQGSLDKQRIDPDDKGTEATHRWGDRQPLSCDSGMNIKRWNIVYLAWNIAGLVSQKDYELNPDLLRFTGIFVLSKSPLEPA